MTVLVEVARFLPDDPDPLVQASFACTWCLHEPTAVTVEHGPDGSSVACRCQPCERSWAVVLAPEQGLRLQLRPPWDGMATHVRRSRTR
jgi:hypothetical protein